VVITSAYTKGAQLDLDAVFIEKPFSSEQILEAIASAFVAS
jgi:FixJ family two-component response regulator